MGKTNSENPWTKLLSGQEYLLEQDRSDIKAFNKKHHGNSDKEIHLEVIPEPYLGDPNAPVVLLNLNPGFDAKDKHAHANPSFKRKSLANLRHKQAKYPFYLLDPDLNFAPGFCWWKQKLGPLMGTLDDPRGEKVSKGVFCVEFFPYHSETFSSRWNTNILPSQEYSFRLVQRAIRRNALILIMRSGKIWREHVPELKTYSKDRWEEASSPQNPAISPNNFPKLFLEIVRRLRGTKTRT